MQVAKQEFTKGVNIMVDNLLSASGPPNIDFVIVWCIERIDDRVN